ncbi:MAG: alpha/beta hydrolase [Alphaproteobacteria bacterium]
MKPIISLLIVLALAGCATPAREEVARELAEDIAGKQLPIHAAESAGDFTVVSYARIGQKGAAAQVYIEGDGHAWETPSTPSANPTPDNPVALQMAVQDNAPNVIWLARPCQYEAFSGNCPQQYWTSRRFAPEVIAAYNRVLDTLRQKYSLQGFVLNGYSGGGAIAVLAAAGRGDVLGLRTAAGNLDTEAVNALHGVSPMPKSLNPRDWAEKVKSIPQRHYSGGRDIVVPAEIFAGYNDAAGGGACIHHGVVAAATHRSGWAEAWPGLLQQPLVCK